MNETSDKPIVFISYSWRTYGINPATGRPLREADERAEKLAEDLRNLAFDSRIDVYFKNPKYGFKSPVSRAVDEKSAWRDWASEQITAADCVLLMCTPDYIASMSGRSSEWRNWHIRTNHPSLFNEDPFAFLWWDWHFMLNELEADASRQDKFIPIGFGPYELNRQNIPDFVQGLTYYNMESKKDVEGLHRRIRTEYYKRRPRRGVFISYSHKDEKWLDMLLKKLKNLEGSVAIWTDKRIRQGQEWDVAIQNSLMNAEVAVLLITPAFLASDYIANHELPAFLQAAKHEGLNIFWIPVEKKPLEDYPTEITQFQAAHPVNQPLSELPGEKLDQTLEDIVSKLANILGIDY